LIREKRVIVIARAKKEWYRHIPELESYEKKVVLKNYRNPIITQKNCEESGFELIEEALN